MANCEDLATKAELQELRDQINTLLGQSADGTSTVNVLQAGTLEGTTMFASLALAGTAIQKLVVSGNVGSNLIDALASGGAWFETVKGNGTKVVVDSFKDIGKGIKTNAAKLTTVGSGLAASAGAIATVSSIALGIGNSLLNIGTLKLIEQNTRNTEFQTNAYNREYTNLLNFISQNNEDIAQANATNAANQQVINEQIGINNQQATQIQTAQANIIDLSSALNEQVQEVERANAAILTLQAQVETIEEDATEFKAKMQEQVEKLAASTTANAETNNAQNTAIQTLEATIVDLGQYIGQLDRDLFFLGVKVQEWVGVLEDLGYDLETAPELADARSKLLSAKAILATREVERTRSGGGTATAVGAATTAQNGILDLASNLAGTAQGSNPTITNDDTYNNTTTFKDTLANLISQISLDTAVNDTDIQNIRDGVKLDMEDLIPLLIGATVIPGLNTIQSQTRPQALADAAAAGVCTTTQPGGCMQNNILNPLQGNIDKLINASGTAFSAANNALLVAMQGTLATLSTTANTIKSTTSLSYGVLTHASHGLEAVQNFASTAWRVTRADKVMNGVAMVMTIHNGMMLSNNLLSTISEATNMTLDALGIRDETDEPLDFGAAIKAKISAVMSSLLGETAYAELTARIAKANRIYQSSINLLDTVYSLADSARNVAELTAENTGKIGNALRESGAVYEDAYEEFIERVSPQNRAMRNLDKFREGLESVENIADNVAQISGSVVETQETWEQLKLEKENWKTEVNTAIETEVTLKAEEKAQVNVSADIQDGSFDTASPEDTST